MKRINLRDIGMFMVFLLYLSFIALGMISCGARKTDRQLVKEEVKVENTDNSTIENKSSSNVKENVVVKIDDKNNTITEEVTYEPKDPSKEAFIVDPDGKKTVLNNSKKTTKKTTQNNNTKSEIKSDSEKDQKQAVKEVKDVKTTSNATSVNKTSKTEREAVSMWNWLWLIIPIVIVIWLFRKYRDKIWWV